MTKQYTPSSDLESFSERPNGKYKIKHKEPKIKIGEAKGNLTCVSGPIWKNLNGDWVEFYTMRDVNGEERIIQWHSIRSGKSLGIRKKKAKSINKLNEFTEENVRLRYTWHDIRNRCMNPAHPSYYLYGARGITISEQLQDINFFLDYIKSIDGYGIESNIYLDRINNSKGYEVGNLRWTNAFENIMNRRVTIYVSWHGQSMPLREWFNNYYRGSLLYKTIYCLYKQGKTLDQLMKHKPHRRFENELKASK